MWDFLLGAAIIALPPQKQIPLAIGTALLKGVQNFRKKKRERIASILNPATDEVELVWSALSVTLKEKDGDERVLLDKLHGKASPGRLLCVIGPSGSGKTTLLNALAGQLPYTKKMHLEGYITANGQAIPVPGIRSGFVAQEDLFFSQMTVKETLMMATEMRSASISTPEAREALVDNVIRRLGLGKCSDTPVGDAKTRGLSGGEKKRLSIACELVSKPQLILADEPTSGLDAFAAQQAMQALKDLTDDNHTVIASIHQPRSSIFAMFDDLCLLSDGQLIYFGPAQEALAHFEKLGHVCPLHYNPAEFLADLVAIDHSDEVKENESRQRVMSLAAAWENETQSASKSNLQGGGGELEARQDSGALVAAGYSAGNVRPGCSLRRQIALLLKRSWRQVTRDKATLASRASSQISSAVVFSGIYWRMGRGQADIQDRLGLLQVSAVGVAMTAMIKTLNVFPQERTIVTRERSRAAYPVFPYLVAKLAAELPVGAIFPAMFGSILYPSAGLNAKISRFGKYLAILTAESFSAQALGLAVGAAAPSTSAALAIGPAVMLVFIVFGGLFVNAEGLPTALKLVPSTSLIKQSFEGACINEFQGENYEPDDKGRGDVTGEQVLARLAFSHDKVESTLINQGRITVFYWWVTYCVLQAKKPKYLPVLPPRRK